MNAMTSDQWTIFIAAMLLGAPFVLMAGKLPRRMALILGFLWLLFSHPFWGVVLGAVIILHKPVRWLIEGLAIGEGLKWSGVFQARNPRALRPGGRYPRRRAWTDAELTRHDEEDRRGPPRAAGRRPADYAPFDDTIYLGEGGQG